MPKQENAGTVGPGGDRKHTRLIPIGKSRLFEEVKKRFDGDSNGIVVIDSAERVVFVNAVFSRLSGYDRETLLGTFPPFPWFNNGGPREREREQLRFLVSEHAEVLGVSMVATELVPTRGKAVPTWMSCQAVVDQGGANHGYVMSFVNPSRLAPPKTVKLSDADARLEQQRRCLHRIAQELEQVGIPSGVLPVRLRSELWPELALLSPREWEVLWLLLDGHRVSAIAGILHISPSTVRNHLQSIYGKVGVRSQGRLIEKLRVPLATPSAWSRPEGPSESDTGDEEKPLHRRSGRPARAWV